MPLSEHEERILAEIERQLAEDDPAFVQRARRVTSREQRVRRLRWSVLGFVVGLGLLLGLAFAPVLGYVGFALMLVSVVVGARAVTGLSRGGAQNLTDRLRRGLNGDSDGGGDAAG